MNRKYKRSQFLIAKEETMLVWCVVLLFLGITAFLDSIFTQNEIFRTINSVFFMLVSLGLLVRTSTKQRIGRRESYQRRIQELEQQIVELTRKERSPQKTKVEA
jgi:protein-S-isoprenylcysteine O-methyltransferase Ste14